MSQRVITQVGEHTSHYVGQGYEYFFASDKQKGRQCKLRCPKKMMDDFVQAKGKINSTGMQYLQVLEQSPGWWLICSDQPEHDGVVVEFIAKFNRWALRKVPLTAVVDTRTDTQKRRYTIEVRDQQRRDLAHLDTEHDLLDKTFKRRKVQLIDTKPKLADENSLQSLAAKINEKFGHTRSHK